MLQIHTYLYEKYGQHMGEIQAIERSHSGAIQSVIMIISLTARSDKN